MSRNYSASEIEEIIERHRDADRGMRLIGLCIAAASGFLVACLLFGAVRVMGLS